MADPITALIQSVPLVLKLGQSVAAAARTAESNAQLLEFQTALIGFQSLIASVQQENSTLAAQKREAEEELRRMKDWKSECERYKLVSPHTGVSAYAIQRSMSNGEAAHYLCANCFQNGKKSFLAQSGNKEGWVALVCSACKFTAQTRYRALSGPKYAEDVTTE